jgi:hypothetical protein
MVGVIPSVPTRRTTSDCHSDMSTTIVALFIHDLQTVRSIVHAHIASNAHFLTLCRASRFTT